MLVKNLLSGKIVCFFLLSILCFFSERARGQYFTLAKNKKHVSLPFRLVRNMVIVQLRINNKGPYNFVLDTGVGLMIITDPCIADTLNISYTRTIKLSGFGEGSDYDAYITSALRVDIDNITGPCIFAAVLKSDTFGLSNYAGIPIHGLLGYDFFSSLVVKFNFNDSTLTAIDPESNFRFKNACKMPLTIERNKPYVNIPVKLPNGQTINEKLVVDIGAGHSLLLQNMVKDNGLPDKFITANLGLGFDGPISGFISRINEVGLGKYKFRDVLISIPDGRSVSPAETTPRDGNLGLGILKRFNIMLDYTHQAIYIKPNTDLKKPFEHDMSGMEYYAGGDHYDHIFISRVEPGSAADLIGVHKDDEIVCINFKPVAKMTLEEIDEIFKSKADRSLLLEIYRNNKPNYMVLTLKRRI